MHVLITGLEGFTGRYLKMELEDHGHSVSGLQSDITDAGSISAEVARLQPEAVIHLAAIAFVEHNDPAAFYRVNLLGTQNLLMALETGAPKVQSVLLASSANIYGNQKSGCLSEDTPPQPVNDYAVSKYAMELMAGLRRPQLPLIIVRPFNYTGVGQDDNFLIPKIVNHYRRREAVIELGNLEVWREFGDVRMVAKCYRKLLEMRSTAATLNICTGQPHSLNEVLSICELLTGHLIEVRVNPQFKRKNEVRELYGDNTRLTSIIGELPTFNLEQTLSWMLSAPMK